MTDKKEKIINSALVLFANEGFSSTSTSRIAIKAGVSEGLIFRHFHNKKDLLNAIMKNAEQKIGELFWPILNEQNPEMVIRKTIELPFEIKKADHDFWKLQYKLKWESEYDDPEKLRPLTDKLTWAFSELGYDGPELEATLLVRILDSFAIEVLKGNLKNKTESKEFLYQKYKV